MIIDFHVHVYPDEIAKRALPNMARISGITPALDGTMSDLQRSMSENNIDYSVLMPVATKPGHVEKMNSIAIEQNKLDHLFSFGCMHPDFSDMKNEFRRIKEAGIRGIKLHFDYMGLYVDDEASLQMINEAFDAGLMVLIHAGYDPVSPTIHYTTVERICNALSKLTKGTLILAHYGGFSQTKETLSSLLDKDVYFDLSTTHFYSPLEDCKNIVLGANPERLLYGSDSPWFPQSSTLDIMKKMELSEELTEQITWKNAARLLGLS